MRCLVTGGAGFIGSHLVRRLCREGHDVAAADNYSTGKRERLTGTGVEVFEIDLTCDPLEDAVRGRDVVFHLAALPSVPRSVKDPLRSHDASATATLRTLVAARDAGVRRFVTSSSSSVYGNVADPPMRESMATVPRSPYAVGKLAAEGYTRVFALLYGMEAVSLRYFNVFGPGQDSTSQYAAAIPQFVRRYLSRTAPTVFGDGMQSRDFTFVDNVVEANVRAALAPRLGGEHLNIGAGEPRTVIALLDSLAQIFGYRVEPEFAPERPGDIRHSHADIAAARTLIGYRAIVGFDDGLASTVEWLRRQPAPD